MDYNKIRINFTGYNRTLSQYEEAKAEAEKTYTPEALNKWNKEAAQSDAAQTTMNNSLSTLQSLGGKR